LPPAQCCIAAFLLSTFANEAYISRRIGRDHALRRARAERAAVLVALVSAVFSRRAKAAPVSTVGGIAAAR